MRREKGPPPSFTVSSPRFYSEALFRRTISLVKAATDSPVLIRLFQGDLERLLQLYPKKPYNLVIRSIVKAHLDSLERRLDKSSGVAPRRKEKDFD